jgi:hypothetical protein
VIGFLFLGNNFGSAIEFSWNRSPTFRVRRARMKHGKLDFDPSTELWLIVAIFFDFSSKIRLDSRGIRRFRFTRSSSARRFRKPMPDAKEDEPRRRRRDESERNQTRAVAAR